MEKMIGLVNRIKNEKGFLFIRVKGEKNDYFLHKSNFIGNWEEMVEFFNSGNETEIIFDPIETLKGNRAENAKRVISS